MKKTYAMNAWMEDELPALMHLYTPVYLASEVDARIAELEKALRAWTGGEHAQWCGTVRNSVDPCDCGYGLIENSTL